MKSRYVETVARTSSIVRFANANCLKRCIVIRVTSREPTVEGAIQKKDLDRHSQATYIEKRNYCSCRAGVRLSSTPRVSSLVVKICILVTKVASTANHLVYSTQRCTEPLTVNHRGIYLQAVLETVMGLNKTRLVVIHQPRVSAATIDC
uniref:Secreted protein n=1 Tax=Echinococcus granulosus TaxID=6210 RepID=U6FVH0_ECHGR|nr:hypothetical protein EgrG_002065500 [Echinococcus granulosus]